MIKMQEPWHNSADLIRGVRFAYAVSPLAACIMLMLRHLLVEQGTTGSTDRTKSVYIVLVADGVT